MGVSQDLPEAQEEAGAFALTDQVELLIQPVLRPLRKGGTVVSARQPVAGVAQVLVGAAAVARFVVWEDVAQVTREVEVAALCNPQPCCPFSPPPLSNTPSS